MSPGQLIDYCREMFGTPSPPDAYVDIPCGRCKDCLASARREVVQILSDEAEKPLGYNVFVTLTFNDFYYEKFFGSDNKVFNNRPLTLFLDRFRKTSHYCKGVSSHFFISELGAHTRRFHYHGLMFHLSDLITQNQLQSIWKYGFVWIGYVNQKTIKYVSKYINKREKNPTRRVSSLGLGRSFDGLKQEFGLPRESDVLSSSSPLALPPYLVNASGPARWPRTYLRRIKKAYSFKAQCSSVLKNCIKQKSSDYYTFNGLKFRTLADYESYRQKYRDEFVRLGFDKIKK